MSLFFGDAEEDRSSSWGGVSWGDGGSPVTTPGVSQAMRLTHVYAAIGGIVDDISTTPLKAYKALPDGSREPLSKQPSILSPRAGLITWLAQGVMSCLTRGNAFGYHTAIGANGWPAQVDWIRPDRIRVDESGPFPTYHVDGIELDSNRILHISGLTPADSVVGMAPLTLFRTQIAKAQRAEQYAADLYDRGVMPPGILRNEAQTLTPEASALAKARFKAAVAGRDIFVTGKDWNWSALTVPKDDAEFLQTIEASATQIAAVYRVAPEEIGGKVGGSLTYSTLEMNELKRIRRALMPWFLRLEAGINSLLPRPQFVKFNLDSLARADLKTRMEAHEIQLRTGLETLPEARRTEDRAPLTPEELAAWRSDFRTKPDPAGTATRKGTPS